MILDILFLGMLAMAIFKGFQNGLIVAVFSIVAWIVGLVIALRFSYVAADYLKPLIDVSPKMLYIISFLLVLSLVLTLVNLGARLVEKAVGMTPIGWLNRIGGIFFYVLLYTLIFSVIIYFAEKVKLINEETISSSRAYRWVRPLAHFIQGFF